MLVRCAELAGPVLLRVWRRTLRISWGGDEHLAVARDAGPGNVLFVLWHAHLLLLASVHGHEGICVLVSQHRDGEFIARVIERLGFGTVRGSSTRGGREALHHMAEAAGRGADLAVTPDGPRGPRGVVQPGVILLAQRTGLPIVPVAAAGPRDWVLGSWDRFRIPRPLGRCFHRYGPHLLVPRELRGAELEAKRRELEERLNRLAAEAAGRA